MPGAALGSHFGVDGFTSGALEADLAFQGIRFGDLYVEPKSLPMCPQLVILVSCFCFAGSNPGSHPAAVILTSSWLDVAQHLSSWTEHTSSWHHPA